MQMPPGVRARREGAGMVAGPQHLSAQKDLLGVPRPRQEEHELHQIQKKKCANQVKADPTLTIDDQKSRPGIWRLIEVWRTSRLRNNVGGKE
jgi:hypothetical protein